MFLVTLSIAVRLLKVTKIQVFICTHNSEHSSKNSYLMGKAPERSLPTFPWVNKSLPLRPKGHRIVFPVITKCSIVICLFSSEFRLYRLCTHLNFKANNILNDIDNCLDTERLHYDCLNLALTVVTCSVRILKWHVFV